VFLRIRLAVCVIAFNWVAMTAFGTGHVSCCIWRGTCAGEMDVEEVGEEGGGAGVDESLFEDAFVQRLEGIEIIIES
jgi:hypothetical protein